MGWPLSSTILFETALLIFTPPASRWSAVYHRPLMLLGWRSLPFCSACRQLQHSPAGCSGGSQISCDPWARAGSGYNCWWCTREEVFAQTSEEAFWQQAAFRGLIQGEWIERLHLFFRRDFEGCWRCRPLCWWSLCHDQLKPLRSRAFASNLHFQAIFRKALSWAHHWRLQNFKAYSAAMLHP